MITFEQLKKCSPYTNLKRLDLIYPLLLKTLERYEIYTPLRAAHFLSQIIHESGSFKYTKEIADGSAYEGRKDLGNTQKGDGVRYKGRGMIQITGRANYKAYSNYTKIDFVNNPQKLEELKHAIDSAGWFWKTRNLNELADKDDVVAITKRINGGKNGLDSRIQILTLCKSILL